MKLFMRVEENWRVSLEGKMIQSQQITCLRDERLCSLNRTFKLNF